MASTNYQDPTQAKNRLLVTLALATAFALAFSISSFYEWYVLADYDPQATPDAISGDTMGTLGLLSVVIILPRVLFLLITAGFFLYWVYRLHTNAHALDIGGSIYSSGWAVTSYLIPFINFVVPLSSLLQLAKAQTNALNRQSKTTIIIVFWWLLFLFSMLIAASQGFFSEENATVEMLRNDALTTSVSEFALFLAGCLVFVIISRLTNQQIAIKNKE